MSIFKCKMCGGDLEVTADSKIVECEYCGTSQTVPSADNEKKTNLFNRANRLRMASEFSKAAGVYESIVAEFPEEPEAYWGLCLCKYGIEYVDDPATAKKVPTCHRTSYESIFEDNNFELALEYADTVAIRLYREEAKEIDRLQKSILEIAAKEEPFDIFICYKETAEDGQRTKDSVLAQDMYDALTAKGYKVFFARITLEDKLGLEYEPYIFSALNSAKVMLAVGTKYEYYNAVWVKNEWSRFLDLMKKDKEKMLIPCYCDIDAYDMPSEFKNLQGQDMSKIGFMQDLVRGIGKIIPLKSEAPVVQQNTTVINSANVNVQNLLKRVFIFLEDCDWGSADEYCERILDINSECGEAYLGKLMAELKVSTPGELTDFNFDFSDNDNYKKVIRFGNEELIKEIDGYLENIKSANLEKYRYNIYKSACEYMQNENNGPNILIAKQKLLEIAGYRDSEDMIEKCNEILKSIYYTEAKEKYKTAKTVTEYIEILEILACISDQPEVKDLLQECQKNVYYHAKTIFDTANSTATYDKAKRMFAIIRDYEDSEQFISKCIERIKDVSYDQAVKLYSSSEASDVKKAVQIFGMLKGWKDSETFIAGFDNRMNEIEKDKIYNRARERLQMSSIDDITAALELFKSISGWRDSDEYIKQCYQRCDSLNNDKIYNRAKGMVSSVQISVLESAVKLFRSIKDWRDSTEYIALCTRKIHDIKTLQEVDEETDYLISCYASLGVFDGKKKKEIDARLKELANQKHQLNIRIMNN